MGDGRLWRAPVDGYAWGRRPVGLRRANRGETVDYALLRRSARLYCDALGVGQAALYGGGCGWP